MERKSSNYVTSPVNSELPHVEYEKVEPKYTPILESILESLDIKIIRKVDKNSHSNYHCISDDYSRLGFAAHLFRKKVKVEKLKNGEYIGN